MLIYSKQQKIIVDTEKFDLIGINLSMVDGDNYPHNECLISAYGSNNFSWIKLAEYKTPEKAQNALKQILIAMTDNLKTFEMPED